MTILDRIAGLKRELEESSSEKYKEQVRRQIERLSYYVENGHWPK